MYGIRPMDCWHQRATRLPTRPSRPVEFWCFQDDQIIEAMMYILSDINTSTGAEYTSPRCNI